MPRRDRHHPLSNFHRARFHSAEVQYHLSQQIGPSPTLGTQNFMTKEEGSTHDGICLLDPIFAGTDNVEHYGQ
jgi:hypothetical protein